MRGEGGRGRGGRADGRIGPTARPSAVVSGQAVGSAAWLVGRQQGRGPALPPVPFSASFLRERGREGRFMLQEEEAAEDEGKEVEGGAPLLQSWRAFRLELRPILCGHDL